MNEVCPTCGRAFVNRPLGKRDFPLGGDEDLDQPAMCASRADITDVATNDPIEVEEHDKSTVER